WREEDPDSAPRDRPGQDSGPRTRTGYSRLGERPYPGERAGIGEKEGSALNGGNFGNSSGVRYIAAQRESGPGGLDEDAKDHRSCGGNAQGAPQVQENRAHHEEVLRTRRAEFGPVGRHGADSRDPPLKQAKAVVARGDRAPFVPGADRRARASRRRSAG